VPMVDAMTALRNCALWSESDNIPCAIAIVIEASLRLVVSLTGSPRFFRGDATISARRPKDASLGRQRYCCTAGEG
jgi:hypothetical protein